jgi:hypothetical protein
VSYHASQVDLHLEGQFASAEYLIPAKQQNRKIGCSVLDAGYLCKQRQLVEALWSWFGSRSRFVIS